MKQMIRIGAISVVILHICDIISTYFGLKQKHLVEGNPIVRNLFENIGFFSASIFKVGIGLLVVVTLLLIYRRNPNYWGPWIVATLYIMIGMLWAVILNNLLQIAGLI